MNLPIQPLPIDERWDCHGCGLCCRGTIVTLNDDDLRRLRDQRWHEHPDFRRTRIIQRLGLFSGGYRLAHRKDESCVFLTPEGRCRIHQELGLESKPLLCRTYPYQLVPLKDVGLLTLRRTCPSAAADSGSPLADQLDFASELVRQRLGDRPPAAPPKITRRHHGTWETALQVLAAIERLMIDERFPHVRRLVHALQLCELLDLCRLDRVKPDQLPPLLEMLETSAVEESAEVFRQRRPPSRLAAVLFRQAVLEVVRLPPGTVPERSWRQRLELIRAAAAFTRGRGPVPPIGPEVSGATFEQLEEPLGCRSAEVLRPLGRYFETAAASTQYAILDRKRWAITESFRALALCHSMALWIVRLRCRQREPGMEDMVEAVTTIDRGQVCPRLAGWHHRRRVAQLARGGQLPRLIAWYAR